MFKGIPTVCISTSTADVHRRTISGRRAIGELSKQLVYDTTSCAFVGIPYRIRVVIINITQAIIQSISWPAAYKLLPVDDPIELPVEPPACRAKELVVEECAEDGGNADVAAGIEASADVAAVGVGNE